MNIWNQITGLFGPKADMLGFGPNAKPSAHDWLMAFTNDFMSHAETAHGVQALMSGLRFYTPDFIAEIQALPAIGTQAHTMAGNIPKAVYTSTGPIIIDVYQKLISHEAGRPEIQAAFTQAMPALIDHYRQKSMN